MAKKNHEEESSCCGCKPTTQLVLSIIQVVLLVIVAILVGALIIGNNNTANTDMAKKIDKIDAFFTKNAQGYGDNAAAPSTANSAPAATTIDSKTAATLIAGAPMEGSKTAKVTIIEFSDFECPYCGRFYSSTYLDLKKQYIDTGKVNLVFRNFPLPFHSNAKPAAIAAVCVRAQLGDAGFFKFHDLAFSNQADLSTENIAKWAVAAGADLTKFTTCIADPKTSAVVDADLKLGQDNGISGTPSFYINGQQLVGAQPLSEFSKVIDAELAK